MNKQELKEKVRTMSETISNVDGKGEYVGISKNAVLSLIDELERPEITEEPTFLEHLTRLFKKHGYDHLGQVALALENDLEISINKELPAIPQFVADYIKVSKADNESLNQAFAFIDDKENKELWEWMFPTIVEGKRENQETFARAWLYGYTIESPKTLQVIVKKYDSTVFKTDIPEDEAMKLIEGVEGRC